MKLQLKDAEAVVSAVRAARGELASLKRAAAQRDGRGAAAAQAAEAARQVRPPPAAQRASRVHFAFSLAITGARCGSCQLRPATLFPQDAAAVRAAARGGWAPAVGATVFVPRLNARARVVAVDGAGVLTLQAGLLKLTAAVAEVRNTNNNN